MMFQFTSTIGNCSIFCDKTRLSLNQISIYFEYEITGIAISKNKVFVLYNKDGGTFEEMPRNNIVAYDFNGKCLWNIEDITQEDWPYLSIRVCDEHTVKKELLTESLSVIRGHEYLVCYTYGTLRFILDITEEKVAQRISARFN